MKNVRRAIKKYVLAGGIPILILGGSLDKLNAQAPSPGDTIEIRAFQYNQTRRINGWSNTPRDTIINFDLPNGVTFSKIFMTYNMRCRDALVSTGRDPWRGCGQWDFSCNTYIHDPNRTDSTKEKRPKYRVNGVNDNGRFRDETLKYTNTPTYDYYEYEQKKITLNESNSETLHTPISATATDVVSYMFPAGKSAKSYHLFTADELQASGLSAGPINGISLPIVTSNKEIRFFKIRIKDTTLSELNPSEAPSIASSTFTEVYNDSLETGTGSDLRIVFLEPFDWNGTDNLLLEFSFTNSGTAESIELSGATEAGSKKSMYAHNGYYCDLSGSGRAELPIDQIGSISEGITISFWTLGEIILVGDDSNGDHPLVVRRYRDRDYNRIVFEAGSSPGEIDRINLDTNDEFDEWHHWAFTKDLRSNYMRIYRDGELRKEVSNMTQPIDDIQRLLLGADPYYNNYFRIELGELRIWNTALSEDEIRAGMYVDISPNHPKYSNLVAYYPFDEGEGREIRSASNSSRAELNVSAIWRYTRGDGLDRYFISTEKRPAITFLRGTYNISTSSTTVRDSLQTVPYLIEEFSFISQAGTQNHDSFPPIIGNERIGWRTTQKFYDIQGEVTREMEVSSDDQINFYDDQFQYYNRYISRMQIMSFVTPYGINLDLGPNGKTWTFDVTDFTPTLKGERRMIMKGGGQWAEDLDIRFHFIVGTPPRDVLDIRQVWFTDRTSSYENIRINKHLAPRDVMMHPDAGAFSIRSAITGHGRDGEFRSANHQIHVNGTQVFDRDIVRECADNPIYPQGGTWIFDRAGWCPCLPSDIYHTDISDHVTAGTAATVDYNVTQGGSALRDASYYVNHQLVSYGPVNHTLDAAVVEVRKPSSRVEFARFGRVCHTPTVVIQNTGSQALTSLKINYWVNDASTPESYTWQGNLESMQKEVVELPTPATLWNSTRSTNNIFHVRIEAPNGGTDEYEFNNTYRSAFEPVLELPSDIEISFRANGSPRENRYELLNADGEVVISNSNFIANRTHTESVTLPPSCYTFRVFDSREDGLYFPFNSSGRGRVSLANDKGRNLKLFEPNFGKSIEFQFSVVDELDPLLIHL